MANISAQAVKELRDKTGAGMMDCKAALGETSGDLEKAVDWLRKKGLAKAANKAGRTAADGLIGLAQKGNKAVLVEVNSETDFVARNEFFQGLVRMVSDIALEVGTDVEVIKKSKVGHHTVAEAIAESVAKIGENMTLRRAGSLSVDGGVIANYMHSAVADGLGKIGVLVAVETTGKAEEAMAFARKVAMHVAASNPQALDSTRLDADVIRREKEVLADKAQQQGKPANVIEKIVESGLKTFYKEVCLLDQAYIHEPGMSVAQAAKEAEGKVGAPIKIVGYLRFALGEGVEREKKDFAAEVAAAVAPR